MISWYAGGRRTQMGRPNQMMSGTTAVHGMHTGPMQITGIGAGRGDSRKPAMRERGWPHECEDEAEEEARRAKMLVVHAMGSSKRRWCGRVAWAAGSGNGGHAPGTRSRRLPSSADVATA